MNNQFESFVETLRCMGVKTLTIEFQQTTAPWLIKYSEIDSAAEPAAQPAAQPKKADQDIFETHGQPENKQVKKITSTEKAKTVKDEPPKEVPLKDTPPVSAKSPYDMFWGVNEEDDGGDQASEQRRTLIGLMTLDDIIRINNDCELGIDTDQPLDQLRNELAACF